MPMRSYLLLTIFVLFALLLSGCGNGTETDSPDTPVETTTVPESAPEVAVEAPEESPVDVVEAPSAPVDEPTETSDVTLEMAAPEEAEDEVVATVNGLPAYRSALDAAQATLLNQYMQMYAQFGMSVDSLMAGAEGQLFRLSLQTEALDRVMAAVLVEEEADRREVRPSNEEVDAEFDKQYVAFLESRDWTEEEFIVYLAGQGTTFGAFKETARDSVSWQMTLDAVKAAIAGPIEPTEDELAAYFAENQADYAQAEEVRASHILVETAEEARDLLAELEAGASFTDLAQQHSTCPSAAQGGDLEWFGRGMMVGPFEETAFGLDIGEMSGVVETEFGYHIILLTDRKDAFDPTLADVIDQVRDDLTEQTRNERMQDWFTTAYDEAELEIRLPLIDAMRIRQDDLDAGIAAFERIRDENLVEDPYLPYYIGTLYEAKLLELRGQRDALEPTEESEPTDSAEEIAALDTEIEALIDRILVEFRLALDALEETEGIQAKIDALEAQLTDAVGDESSPESAEPADEPSEDETPEDDTSG